MTETHGHDVRVRYLQWLESTRTQNKQNKLTNWKQSLITLP
ncbi:hypothetical protein AB4559_18220 [Vibrio sp. 10N.222.51.C8]|nr:hypothetical protein [Vibrio sp. F13]